MNQTTEIANNTAITEANPANLLKQMAETKVTEIRDNRGMVVGEAGHQGDVYVFKVDSHEDIYKICSDLKAMKRGRKTTNRQLAKGTTKGSRHTAEGNGLTIYAPATSASPLEGPTIIAKEDWTLAHPEHAHHKFGPGTFVVRYQHDHQQEIDAKKDEQDEQRQRDFAVID